MEERGVRRVAATLGISLLPSPPNSNGWLTGHCPFAPWRHENGRDRNPSFGITVNDTGYSFYKCLSCGSKGSLPNLSYQLGRLRDYDDSVDYIDFGHKIEKDEVLGYVPELNEDEYYYEEETQSKRIDRSKYFWIYPPAYASTRAMGYLGSRGITHRAAIMLGLRWDEHEERVLFPVYDKRQRFRGFTGRAINPGAQLKVKDYFGLPKRKLLLGEHRCLRTNRGSRCKRSYYGTSSKSNDTLLIVEGLFDYARLRSFGYYYVVAILGTTITHEKFDTLKEINKPIIWMTDNDLAGRSVYLGPYEKGAGHDFSSGAISQLYGQVPQFTVKWPKKVSDPGELTELQAKKMIKNAKLYI